ncbi:hypothetical protein [Vibrio tasmaniensis]|uniref:hypothetical protein n=1 Tax=Vibrio tasmaniensis TaxID=212663 RepID=UPI00107F8C6E|nr:hypothetical protein [Vibrio tasmaniensis]
MNRVWILLLVMSFPSYALNQASIDLLSTPTLMVSQGRYIQAANLMHQQANRALSMEPKLGTKQMWLTAGLADALAAIAAEKSQDPIAYEYWSNSVRYFLMGGSNWLEYKQQLQSEYNQFNARFSVATNSGDASGFVNDSWVQLSSLIDIWDQKLGVFNYDAPATGLIASPLPPVKRSNKPLAKGDQLKQYTPNGKLMLNNEFSNKPTFVVEPSPTSKSTNSEVKAANPQTSDLSGASGEGSNVVQRASTGGTINYSGSDINSPKSRVHPQAEVVTSNISIMKELPTTKELSANEPIDNKASHSTNQQVKSKSAESPNGNDEIQPVVIISPLGDVEPISESNVQSTSPEPHPVETKTIPKGNLGLNSAPAVETVQRRSFIPVTED